MNFGYLFAGIFFLAIGGGFMVVSAAPFQRGEALRKWAFPGFLGCVFATLGFCLLYVAIFGPLFH